MTSVHCFDSQANPVAVAPAMSANLMASHVAFMEPSYCSDCNRSHSSFSSHA